MPGPNTSQRRDTYGWRGLRIHFAGTRDAASAQILNWGTPGQPATDHRVVGAKADILCMGGPIDGRGLLVPLDEEGVPSEVVDQTWLWIEYGGELLDTDIDGMYYLEPVAGRGPPWIYIWTSARRNQRS